MQRISPENFLPRNYTKTKRFHSVVTSMTMLLKAKICLASCRCNFYYVSERPHQKSARWSFRA